MHYPPPLQTSETAHFFSYPSEISQRSKVQTQIKDPSENLIPLGIPIKTAVTEKNRKHLGDNRNREKVGAFSLSPSHLCPALSIFLSPQPPHNTKRPLQRREHRGRGSAFKWNGPTEGLVIISIQGHFNTSLFSQGVNSFTYLA